MWECVGGRMWCVAGRAGCVGEGAGCPAILNSILTG